MTFEFSQMVKVYEQTIIFFFYFKIKPKNTVYDVVGTKSVLNL